MQQHTDTATEIPSRLRATIGRLSRRLRRTVAAGGLTQTSVSVLFTTVRSGPLRMSDLAAAEGMNPTMLSRVVADLEEAGLVRRAPDPSDRRATLLEATAAGRRLHARVRAERDDVLTVQLAALSDADRRALERALPVLEELAERLKGRRA